MTSLYNKFSNFIIYVDESGDHGLNNLDPNYPIFVLVFVIFKIEDYINTIVPSIQKFKFKHFGHDQSILHETDIRKDRGDFGFLKSKVIKQAFIDELTQEVANAPFTIISSVIKKESYIQRYHEPVNPYHIALEFGLERVFRFLSDNYQSNKTTHVIVEKRGKVEDNELELEFRRICDGQNWLRSQLPLEIIFSDKKCNAVGLQIADLIARPIGLSVFKEQQPNRAYDAIKSKFRASGQGIIKGYGLKIFP